MYEGTVDGNFEEKRFPVELKLRLKVGAQVMFTRNDQQKRWANGTLGKVTKLTKDEISVTLNNGETYVVPCCSWESYSYDYNKEERKMKKELTGLHAVPSEVGMGDNGTQEPGHDLRQTLTRFESRHVCSGATLCGTQPCAYVGRSIPLEERHPSVCPYKS